MSSTYGPERIVWSILEARGSLLSVIIALMISLGHAVCCVAGVHASHVSIG
jgi:hypothetical protein